MEEGSSRHGKVLILLHWHQVIFSFLSLVQIHLSLKVIALCNGKLLQLLLLCPNQRLMLVKPKMCMAALPGSLYWENHSGNFFSGRNWVSLKHSVWFCLKTKTSALSNKQGFYLDIFISAQEEYKIPDFKIHNVILPAIKPSLGQCGSTQKHTAAQAGCLPQHQPAHGEGCVTEGHPESPSISVQQFFHRVDRDLLLCLRKKTPLWNIACCGSSCHLVNAFITIIIFS